MVVVAHLGGCCCTGILVVVWTRRGGVRCVRRRQLTGGEGRSPLAASYLIRSVVARLPSGGSATGGMATVPVLCSPAGAPCLNCCPVRGRRVRARARWSRVSLVPVSWSSRPYVCCWAVSFALIAGGHTPVMYSHECVCT